MSRPVFISRPNLTFAPLPGEPEMRAKCNHCQHEFGVHALGLEGPCLQCPEDVCHAFALVWYIYPQPATAEEMYEMLRKENAK